MFQINISPYFQIGSREISWAAVGYILAMTITIVVSILELRRRGIFLKWSEILYVCIVFIIGAFIGGRLFYILDNLNYYINYPSRIINLSGIVIYGAVIGSIAAITAYLKIRGLPLWKHRDAVAPGSMLGMSLYRFGCIVSGCCYGLPSTSSFSVVYLSHECYAPTNIALYPTQEYHLLLGLAAFVILWILRDKLKPDGSLFLLWLILFSAGDLAVRFFRVANTIVFNWQLAQIIDVAMLLVTIPLLITQMLRYQTQQKISNVNS